ncbi:MAG TPA: ribbon-helix-helix protein, CopG family [Thermoanaerobaculia bacterium]|nr:ribbon-helix-helix protein, CopG family [Thermoanaerobaculia bacterium]
MKPIQILIDEPLLRRLDADEEVRRLGRSEVLRRAADEYLRRRRSRRVTDAYRRA